MEHCTNGAFTVKMIPLKAGWSDLGTWESVWRALTKDGLGNAYHGDVYLEGSRNTLVNASSRLVCLVGVKDICVIETSDAVLIVDKNQSQEVKKLVTTLHANKRQEDKTHRKVVRPWGWYDSIEEGENYKVKHIVVKPGECISLQKHNYRAEHWIVVKGVAEVTKGDEISKLIENESTYIPLGTVHRLRNPGEKMLEIIEIQTGTYLNEDDIIRIEDIYGRDTD
jgi:mannose-1-phosphate guanylyltransferase/mannose-6-phosphate isomerase